MDETLIMKQMNNTLDKTYLPIKNKYQGKVRDNYYKDDKIIMITTDRISAFDHVLGTIPFKGQVLNQLAVFWFKKTDDIVKNHLIDVPDPNVMVVRKCEPIPVEMIVRGYITGSLWRDYTSGKREMYGMKFDEGLKKDQKFAKPIFTPSTKEALGKHDMPISKQEILKQGLVDKNIYEQMEEYTLALYNRGVEHAKKQGLILVDTKYEFGLIDGKLVLMDEIHTPDSSRYWIAKEYEHRFKRGDEQLMLDKENIRQWLIEKHNFSGYGTPPKLSSDIKLLIARKYIEVYEQITGQKFTPDTTNVEERITKNLKAKGYI